MKRVDMSGLGPAIFTGALILLLAAAIGANDWLYVLIILAAVVGGVVLLQLLFPKNRFLAIALANFLALYLCLYWYFMEANFPAVPPGVVKFGFLVPIVAFLAGAWWQRQKIAEALARSEPQVRPKIRRSFRWLLPIAGVGALTFVLPDLGLDEKFDTAAFLTLIGATGIIVLWLSRDICMFLLYTGLLFEEFFERLSALMIPAFVFFTFYSLIVVVFASFYRIVDVYSSADHFLIGGVLRDIGFLESFYFSVITLSTVGYGDITPLSPLVRLIAAVQVISGLMLLLFGFSEIMSYARERRESPTLRGNGQTQETASERQHQKPS